MLYVLFLALAIFYNIKKFRKDRVAFLTSLTEAKNASHREMILGHYFYIFIFEGFLALIVAHLISEKAMSIGIFGLGLVYLGLFFVGLYFYQFFVRYIEKQTHLELLDSLKSHLIKELRVNFSMIMLPILVYALINWAFQDSVYEEWGSLWFIGLLFNIIFVSVLTIVCSVILMLRLIPNREITEPEYLEIINKRLAQIGQPNMRVRWIESDIKNAFVVGLKILRFSNQTMFIGRSLRKTLSFEEFDAVVSHELGHVANRHIHKRVLDLLKNFISIILGVGILMSIILGSSFLYWGDDAYLHTTATTLWCVVLCLSWMVFNYSLLFDTLRSHEFESDGYAVIELGASFEGLKSALDKLTSKDELPEYLQRQTKKTEKGRIAKIFSTHPDNATRIHFLDYKIANGLPFNFYISTPQKIKHFVGRLLQWKVSVPLSLSFATVLVWAGLTVKTGREDIKFITESKAEDIIKNESLLSRINTRPQLVGQSLIYFVVKKNDEKLIDHFVKHGADKGKTLMYVSQLKDFEVFKRYYELYQNDLSEDDYFLVLRKTAQMNFTDGYRFLVNAKRFEDLNPSYKEDVSQLLQKKDRQRMPASVNK
jgi:Zn-dependent protease with chaperone function